MNVTKLSIAGLSASLRAAAQRADAVQGRRVRRQTERQEFRKTNNQRPIRAGKKGR